MIFLRWSLLVSLAVLAAGPGCGSIEVAGSGNPERILNGTVSAGGALPAGAEIVVRLMAPPPPGDGLRPAANEMPVASRAVGPAVERVLGEHVQTLTAVTAEPVPFRLAYHADDATLRRGLNLDVRVSVAGRLRFRTISAHVVTLASSPYPQAVTVQPIAR